VRRLFSTFARGWPGVGLLLMRLVAGCAFILQSIAVLRTGLPSVQLPIPITAIAAAVLLIGGLWTPIAGTLIAVIGVFRVVLHRGDPLASVLVATMGMALALLGPGAWSVDAYLFGWRRVDVRNRSKDSERAAGSTD
jgi:putative oxidoreductase